MGQTRYIQAESEDEASEYGQVIGYTPPNNGSPDFYSVEVE